MACWLAPLAACTLSGPRVWTLSASARPRSSAQSESCFHGLPLSTRGVQGGHSHSYDPNGWTPRPEAGIQIVAGAWESLLTHILDRGCAGLTKSQLKKLNVHLGNDEPEADQQDQEIALAVPVFSCSFASGTSWPVLLPCWEEPFSRRGSS